MTESKVAVPIVTRPPSGGRPDLEAASDPRLESPSGPRALFFDTNTPRRIHGSPKANDSDRQELPREPFPVDGRGRDRAEASRLCLAMSQPANDDFQIPDHPRKHYDRNRLRPVGGTEIERAFRDADATLDHVRMLLPQGDGVVRGGWILLWADWAGDYPESGPARASNPKSIFGRSSCSLPAPSEPACTRR